MISDDQSTIVLPQRLADELVGLCVDSLPNQSYGLLGGRDVYHPSSLYPCSTNLRNTEDWKQLFESFGDFYLEPDRGFVIAPEEYFEIIRRMRSRGEKFVGVYHSHRYQGPLPTKADMTLHADPDVPAYIVSVADPPRPELRIFRLLGSSFETVTFRLI